MELADDIAYGIHDLEDAIVTGVVNQQEFEANVMSKLIEINDPWVSHFCQSLASNLFSDEHYLQKDAIGELVNYLITEIELTDLNTINNDVNFDEPLLQYNATFPNVPKQVLQIFKDFVFQCVIKQTSIQRLEYRGQQIVMELFETLSTDPLRLLPKNSAKRWQQAKDNNENEYRVIADYISGMTDEYATRLYQALFLPKANTSYHLS